MQYPHARRDDISEEIHGTTVADPYRWLENTESPETRSWIDAEDELCAGYLASLPERPWFEAQLRKMLGRPRSGTPYKKAGRYFVSRNDGEQAQDVWCWASTLDRLAEGGKLLVDPNRLGETGDTYVVSTAVSEDGRYFAYALSDAGSDWMTIRVRDIDQRVDLPDELRLSKLCTPAWLPDNQSLVYLHYPSGADRSPGQQPAGVLKVHRLGTGQDQDEVLLDSDHDSRMHVLAEVSYDGRWLITAIFEGTSSRNRLWAWPLTTGSRTGIGAPVRMFDEPDARYDSVRVVGDDMLVRTNRGATRFRLVRVAIVEAVSDIVEVIPEQDGLLSSVTSAGGALVTVHLEDAVPLVHRYSLDGRSASSIPVAGSEVLALRGRSEDTELFVGMASAATPLTSYRVDLQSFDIVRLSTSMRQVPGKRRVTWQPPVVRVRRETARSVDGTVVPYFLLHREDLALDAPRPTMLYGYGGLNVPTLASFRPGWPAWLEAGGVLVVANVRGGGEYGAEWHDAGRLRSKQRTFDDFIAVAEALIHRKVTTSAQLAMHGRSVGGLLVGAVLTQRPDLAAAALPMVGVLDMMRFHRFTAGASFTPEFGSPDDPQMTAILASYSPLHNVRDGERYPATLVLTGEHDDRVAPAHSYKLAAALQHAQTGPAPILARIESHTGHGKGKPRGMVAAEWADLLAFAAHHTGLRPGQ